ncbi:MAG TPA: hypothetical protein VKY74_07410, partial [Chloroflexia bacterium]|nr:hypothetical protein [Chloroflexia bacterium]
MSRPIAGLQAAYYARIVPVLGAGLGEKRIAVCGVAAVAGAVERLAGCRALHWWIADDRPLAAADPLVRGFGAPAGAPAGPALAALLQAHNTWEAGWAFRHYPALTAASYAMLAAAWQPDPPDLLLGGGDLPALVLLARLGRALNRPILLVAHCAGADPAAACLALLPGDAGQGRDLPDLLAALGAPPVYDPAALPPDGASWPAWAETNGLAALLAKALLTHGTPLADPALDSLLWSAHRTAAVIGTAPWPWTVQHVDLARAGRRPGDSRQSSVVSRQSSVVRDEGAGIGGRGSGRDEGSANTQSKIQNPKSKIALIVGCGSLG